MAGIPFFLDSLRLTSLPAICGDSITDDCDLLFFFFLTDKAGNIPLPTVMIGKLVMMSDESYVDIWVESKLRSIEKQTGFRAVVSYWDDLPCSIPPALGPFGKCLETWSGAASYLYLLVRGQACSRASHGAQGSPPKQRIIWSQVSIVRTLGWGTLKVTECEIQLISLAHFTYTGFFFVKPTVFTELLPVSLISIISEWNDFQLVHLCRVDSWFTITL